MTGKYFSFYWHKCAGVRHVKCDVSSPTGMFLLWNWNYIKSAFFATGII